MARGPHPRHLINNWRNSDGPFAEKLGKLIRNNVKKATTVSHCCGNHGEPGC
ncbi:MAG: hypothetical protein HKN93_02650 [Acidimicrobiia bacterium]|nr:hypothetical protein [Acidimicrobiia bacterium]